MIVFFWSQEAIRHFNQTATLKQMMSLVENYFNLDDRVGFFFSPLHTFLYRITKKRPLQL